MNPTDRRVRRSSLRKTRPLDAFVALALAAFALGLAMPWIGARWPGALGSLAGQFGGMSREEEILVARLEAAQDKALEHVVLQLDSEPGTIAGVWPEYRTPWGHVPWLTLFDDGTIVYIEADSMATIPYSDWLEPAAADALVAAVLDAGFDNLPSEAEHGALDDDGRDLIVRLRRDDPLDGQRVEHTVRIVDSDDTENAIFALFGNFSTPNGVPMPAESAVLYKLDVDRTADPVALTALERAFDWIESRPEAYPGDSNAIIPAHDAVAQWPEAVDLPQRFPVHIEGDDLAALRQRLPLEPGRPEAVPTPGEASETASEWAIDEDIHPSVFASSYWGWTFRMPEGRGTTSEARIVAVPWIYGERYPDVQADIARVADAIAAVAEGYANAQATDAALQAIATDEAAQSATPVPVVEAEDSEAELPMAFPFPPDVNPEPLAFGLGIQTWRHWMAQPGPLYPLIAETTPRMEWLKQRYAWSDLEPFGPTAFQENKLHMYPDAWLDSVIGEGMGERGILIQLDVPPAWSKRYDVGAGDAPFDLVAWERFVHQFARRYAGMVGAYEIMNEPNLAREWGGAPDPAAYAKVLATAYRAIKMADPYAVVVSAGLAPTSTKLPEAMGDDAFLQGLYDAMDAEGGSALYFDALGAHAPGFAAAPSVSPDDAAADPALGGHRTFTFRRVEDLRRIMVERGDEAKQVVVTEFGWTTDARPDSPYTWSAVTEEARAQHVRSAHDFARDNWAPWIGPLILFTAADPAWTPDHEAWWWSVTGPGGGLRQEIRDAFAAP